MNYNGTKALILGGLGFIGSNLAGRLVSLGADVTIVDSMLPQYGGNLENVEQFKDHLRINYSDIRDTHTLDYIVRNQDVIFSLAGQTSHIASMHDPKTDLDINCTSQLSILEACKNHNPDVAILYASTRQLYGRPQYLPVDEKHPVIPVDVNGINKYAAEMYYTLYSRLYNMRCASLRLTNTYGPGQQLRGNHQGFVGVFLRQAIQGEGIKVFGDGTQRRDFNYVDDVVEAFLLAYEHLDECCGKALNLGAEDIYSILDFLEILGRYIHFKYDIIPFPEDHKAIDIGDYYSDYSAFRSITGWEPETSLPDGLLRSVEYFTPRIGLYS